MIQPLFTIGSVQNTSASGADRADNNIVKKPNWPEANQLAIQKRGGGFELRATETQIRGVARAGLEPGTAGL